ncbi:MAG: imidazole glycerol phosphate synthase subunit HisH [Bacteroidaceae bacterium]|nr:imidazole glycerol phosphate synthase subunit HisH [Bacteroidaceae bacterium]
MQVAIVKYNAGNIYSVLHALRRVGAEPVLTDDAEVIRRADRVVFPGQGEAATTIASLRRLGLDRLIPTLTQPVLGICIGQQLMCASSEEGGGTECLGIFPDSRVRRFVPRTTDDKIPHMGWNTVRAAQSPLFEGVGDGTYFYFIHSYYVPACAEAIAVADYSGTPFAAAMRRGNFFATQFHPEKSGAAGERLLRNFLNL